MRKRSGRGVDYETPCTQGCSVVLLSSSSSGQNAASLEIQVRRLSTWRAGVLSAERRHVQGGLTERGL